MNIFHELSRPVKLSVSLLLIGQLFRFQHLPFANGIIMISVALIGVFYFRQFWRKRHKAAVDYLMLLGVLLVLALQLSRIFFLPYRLMLLYALLGVFVVVFVMKLFQIDYPEED